MLEAFCWTLGYEPGEEPGNEVAFSDSNDDCDLNLEEGKSRMRAQRFIDISVARIWRAHSACKSVSVDIMMI